MNDQMPDVEQKILAVLQKGLPAGAAPYKEMALQAGMDTEKFLEVLADWKKNGKLRRVGAILNHFKAGLGYGAMVAWQVPSERAAEIGRTLAGFAEVSHAYERRCSANWPYNLYTMVHGSSAEDVKQTVERMSEACRISDYRMLVTKKELKKAPPTYVSEAELKQ